jgi:hypothetical protein
MLFVVRLAVSLFRGRQSRPDVGIKVDAPAAVDYPLLGEARFELGVHHR